MTLETLEIDLPILLIKIHFYQYFKKEGCAVLAGFKEPLGGFGFGWEGAHRKM